MPQLLPERAQHAAWQAGILRTIFQEYFSIIAGWPNLALSGLLRQKESFPGSQVKNIKKDVRIVCGSDVK
ncbi:hypothetical protein [uncultured Desulfovibrio sp.]|uniref:hypothetical protein n=1 Tax=uncultured Desulfovibrio sp. TaxID=167968 RepID=UPI0025DBE899|nr:hypothetical protein [uncultured Desulfovibrio sp.]